MIIDEASPKQATPLPARNPQRGLQRHRSRTPHLKLRSKPTRWERMRADAGALLVFTVLCAIALWHRFTWDNWLLDYDILTFFLPWYGVLGERLRDFDIPGWTRHFSAGAPLAGDPSAGWMYAPVMAAFTIATGATAFKLMVAIQVLIGGFSTYAFGRCLGLRPPAALLSAIAFGLGPFLYGQTSFTTVAAQVATWIMVGLLGVELSLRAVHWRTRIAWWAFAGFAIAQMSVAWPGQGMVNGMLIVAGWIGYRTLLWPLDTATAYRQRTVTMIATGIGVLVLGLALGAAGLLPRLSVNEQSSIAGGDYSSVIGGNYESAPTTLFRYVRETVSDEILFRPLSISGGLVVLALLAPLVARARHGVPFFLGVYAVAVILAFPETVVHQIFYLIPQFETMHEHGPRRFLWIVSFAPALLAGATLQSLLDRRLRPGVVPLLVFPLALVVIARQYLLWQGVDEIGPWLIGASLVATVFVLLASLSAIHQDRNDLAKFAIIGLLATVFIAPTGRDIMHTLYDPAAALSRDDPSAPSRRLHADPQSQYVLNRYLRTSDPGTAASFLQARRDEGEHFRYVGYAGRFYPNPLVDTVSYSSRRMWWDVMAILVSGRAGTLQLDGTQVYNPTTLAHYARYIETMNRGTQDYHWQDPYPNALARSPLIDMLNVRYIVVARSLPMDRPDVVGIATGRPVAYQDGEVTIYENLPAYDRAWIVHDVRPNNGGNGLAFIANGTVDGHRVAVVDGEQPHVSPPDPVLAASESVTITHYEDDALSASVTAASPGLVVFSEIYAEGWRAYVDGEEVEILRTNEALRGVPVSGGQHTIEMRYDPIELKAGLWITGVSGLGVLALAGWNALSWLTAPRNTPMPSAPTPAAPSIPIEAGAPKPAPERRKIVRRPLDRPPRSAP